MIYKKFNYSPLPSTTFNYTAIEFEAWTSNYIPLFYMDVIIHALGSVLVTLISVILRPMF